MMAQLAVLVAGLLLIAGSEASDVADRSTLEGFLYKYVPSGSDASKSPMSEYDKFITPSLNHVKHDLPKIADREEEQTAQNLLANNSNDPISLSVFGIGLVSFVTMLGLSLRRALHPATIPTNSGGLGLDMPMMEMKSQDSHVKVDSDRVGWGQLSSVNSRPATLCHATKEDMAALAEANPDYLGSSLGLWDPLGCLNLNFWNVGNEETIGYLRHAEIKHGRVAMAAFLGYLAQSTPVVAGEHAKLPYKGYEPGLTPPEQWDAIPLAGKLQIFILIGMLESYGEILPVHYTKGGLPGYYPPIKGNRNELIFNLFDPFNWFDENKDKVRGRQVEINNGRLAMLGIFSILSESKVPGSVPLITGLIPEYKGDYMVPFEADFSLFG